MARSGVGRRLLAALAGFTPAFTATEVVNSGRGVGRRLLAALAGSTSAFRSAEDSDEYASGVSTVVEAEVHDTSLEPSGTERPGVAVHRTIVVVDVEGFGDPRRTRADQLAVRAGLYQVLGQAFEQAGVSWAHFDHEDRGDGVFVVAPAETPKTLFADALPHALVTELHRHNATHSDAQRIRMRMALHAGEVTYGQHGGTGTATNLAFHLLNATPLRTALAESQGVLAVITSDSFFDEVIRHSVASNAATYRRVQVMAKETSTIGWISVPDHPYPPGPGLRSASTAEHLHPANFARRWGFISTGMGRILEDALPVIVAKVETRRVLHWLFWPTTPLLCFLLTATSSALGLIIIGVLLLLAGLTWQVGLARVPTPVLVLAGVAMAVPAFFLGEVNRSDDWPSNVMGWVVMVLLIVWLGTYPTVLGTLNRQFLKRRYSGGEINDELGSLRVVLVKSWTAVVTMLLVGAGLAAFVSVVALWHRRRWSAVVAGLVCLISPLLSVSSHDIWFSVNLDVLHVAAAVFAAWPWFQAARLPSWDTHGAWI